MRQHINWISKTDRTFIINLDNTFNPCESLNIHQLQYNIFKFPGGEPHFQIISNVEYPGELIITQRFNNTDDFFNIILANDAAKRMGFTNIKLVLPYFPGARQDRVCNKGEPLTVKIFADLINECNFTEVVISCPHSEVTAALLNNCRILDNESKYLSQIIYNESLKSGSQVNIVCPDAGAGKRVNALAKEMVKIYPKYNINLIRCEKVRDVATGELKEFFVQSHNLDGHSTIICDDICSYGGTFKGLGDALKEKNCGKLILFTSHFDCIEGVNRMVDYFDMVYTTNSKCNWQTLNDKINCFEIKL